MRRGSVEDGLDYIIKDEKKDYAMNYVIMNLIIGKIIMINIISIVIIDKSTIINLILIFDNCV